MLIFVSLLAFWQARWREITASLVWAVTLTLGLKHTRHLPFFFLTFGALVPVCLHVNVEYLKSRGIFQKKWGKLGKALVLVLVLAINLLMGYRIVKEKPLSLHIPAAPGPEIFYYPVGAVDFIKKNGLGGRIVSQFEWGEYLIWELYPHGPVGFDGRYETVYPAEVEKVYTNFIYARPSWREFLVKYPPDMILLKSGVSIADLVRKEPGWRLIYADPGSVLFSRNGPPGE
jgi:hypothetical protein